MLPCGKCIRHAVCICLAACQPFPHEDIIPSRNTPDNDSDATSLDSIGRWLNLGHQNFLPRAGTRQACRTTLRSPAAHPKSCWKMRMRLSRWMETGHTGTSPEKHHRPLWSLVAAAFFMRAPGKYCAQCACSFESEVRH